MAKIAVELERAVARGTANGQPGHMTSRVLGEGDGWHVADVVCTSGPQDRRFEEQHPFFTIAIVLAGTFQYRASLNRAGVAQELMTQGSLLLGNAGQRFDCGHEHGWGDRCLSFRYSPDYFDHIAADVEIAPGQRDFRTLRLPPLRLLSPSIARACAWLSADRNVAWEELAIQLAAQSLAVANGQLLIARNASPSVIARVTRTVRMIECNQNDELSLANLARESGLSPYHFLRTFQQLTGVTPHQYVRRQRLRQAAVRLASDRAKVLHIALDCGFEDVSNFNRAFRTEFGVSPRAYRRQTAGAEA